MTNVGQNHIHIEYGSPSVRGRQIWGGLVAYNEIWATGAHRATFISFAQAVEIGGVTIEKGKYGLFTIPGEEEWIIIINKNWDQHLADDYNQEEDIVRISVTPLLNQDVVEKLTFEVTALGEGSGLVTLKWDQLLVSFEIKNI